MKPLVIVALLVVIPLPLRPQPAVEAAFDSITQRGIEYVYNLDFEEADAEFAQLVRMNPLHPAGHFFRAMVLWWRILIDIDNEQHDDRFVDALDHVIEVCDAMLKKDKSDVTALFFKGGSIGFQGRIKAHRSSWLAAANAGRRALPIVQLASSLDPDNYDIQLGSGIYNYYAEVIPNEYPFVKPLLLFIPKGNKELGIRQLTAAAEKGKYASIEATYFLMQLYYFHEKDYPRSLTFALQLHARFPNNPLFHRYVGRGYVGLANWAKAEEVFSDIVARCGRGQRGYTATNERESRYYLGVAAMNAGRHDDALEHFRRCDQISREIDKDEVSGFRVLSTLRIGMLYDIRADRERAVRQYRRVLAMKQHRDSHRQAEQFLKIPYSQ
jgi:tetratricopeptide (TPR) repeat protein